MLRVMSVSVRRPAVRLRLCGGGMLRVHSAGALLAIALWAPTAVQAQRNWTLGSPSTVVEQLQGKPAMVERLTSLGYEVWHFGESWVRLGTREDRVVGFFNAGSLKVRMAPGADTTREATFTVGSSRDDLLRLEGTPAAVQERADVGEQFLRYGRAVVRVSVADKKVRAWDDPAHTLHVRAAGAVAQHLTPHPTAPASLTATATLVDDGNDGVLDAEEGAVVTVVLRNAGKGTAYGATLALTSPGAHAAVRIVSAARADSILPGRSVTLRAQIAAAATLRDGELPLEVTVREDNGFDLDPPFRMVVRTRAARAPRLVLDGIGVADQSGNGRIEPREIVDITARIANRGAGDARDLRVTITPGAGVLLTPETVRDVALGTLHAGEVRDVHLTAFTNSRADGFPLSLVVHEARARFDTTFVLPLALDRPLASVPDLVVRARDLRAVTAAPPLVVDVDSGIPRGRERRNVVAVVLGVERYQHAPAVPFARRDAAVFREYATRLFGIGDDANRLFFRTDDELTGSELRKVFGAGGWLAQRVSAETDVVVYYAGHGVADLKTHAPYLLPNDADANYPAQTGYALDELYQRLAALGAHSVTVFIDACFSGGTREGGSLFPGARDVLVSVEHPALRSESMAVFTASGADQLANVSPDERHGLFTYWLLKGLRGGADADGDHRVTVSELEQFLRAKVPPQAARQDREQLPQAVARNKGRVLVELP